MRQCPGTNSCPWFTLPVDAEAGEYTATWSLDTGPYQGLVEAVTTFEVVTE